MVFRIIGYGDGRLIIAREGHGFAISFVDLIEKSAQTNGFLSRL